ncbi:hypothetical protein T281_09360 [Rhodomicrobium udaipurense JA643]|uniref:Restriction endonuclease n=1 Tax=Rhodomicrobium udaipurense TaxID=1202716 RepID=A0A8I1GED4_9HYPH|nr:restriction endonuclease [Rhodomicrobium udaipurense]KAI94728.1 hypothetical protein T281_09360 [Rhodomicrobium udaipurense JA643]MBJ7542236.1 restriction endonuclease [Rhodomicrobium udaipurense]
MNVFPHDRLDTADLHIDAVYEGGRNGNAGDDPLPSLLGVSNQGGFRILGSRESPRLVVITTSMMDPEWPDNLDPETGVLTYYGDNKQPGRELHDTPRYGNLLLRNMFEALHTHQRSRVPPILIFASNGKYRDMTFKGLAVPGTISLTALEDLVAVWKISSGKRFQNYQAKLTVLDVAGLSRRWLSVLRANGDWRKDAPELWLEWVESGLYRPLKAARSLEIRNRREQMPDHESDTALLEILLGRFRESPHGFEACAANIVRLFLGDQVTSIDLTRPSRDGGRDALGKYMVGRGMSSVLVDFAMEAKCYDSSNSVGVKDISRLISRLRHRQFGILVTTSWVHSQAYKEIKEDGHPIIIISGGDIIRILKEKGINSRQNMLSWLISLQE